MPKYSIITPMYNSFDLMDRYFKSLINQTYKDFEVIIVDDCSTDDSYEKLKEYSAMSDLDMHIFQTERNAGPGNARNIGMDAAQGEWITFIDNDDWVDTDLLERIDSITAGYDVHCVIYDYYIQQGDNRSIAHSMYYGQTGKASMSECMISVRNHTFGKFYKLIDCMKANIRFPNLRRCEDVAFVARAIDACGSAYYLSEPMYYYRQRGNSLSNNTTLDESDMINAFRILEDNLGEKYPKELKEKSVTDLLYGVVLLMCKAGKPSGEIKEYINNYTEHYPEWWKCKIIRYLGKSKCIFLLMVKHKKIGILKMISFAHSKIIRRGGVNLYNRSVYPIIIHVEYVRCSQVIGGTVA